jgi:AcrR family transcriptional regulator
MPTNTRDRLIESALQRFYRDGFRNVGIDQILADVGISKTAFYKHFECKDDLMLAAMRHQDLLLQDWFRQRLSQAGENGAHDQLRALFDVVEQIMGDDSFRGCIFVNAAMEFPLPHDPVHEAAAAAKKAIEQIVFELAERARADDPRALARELCLLMEGAYVTRHVSRRPDAIVVARRLADQVIDARLPAE